jgi:hypothetical protein
MEADWEVEIGGEAPVMEAQWTGFVDLRIAPEQVAELSEVRVLPALGEALVRLNAAGSPVWTSKCDFWPELEPDAVDADELDAPPGSAAHATGCYIDVYSKESRRWMLTEEIVQWCKGLCARLRDVPLRCCRVDFVVRRALVASAEMCLGVTAYLTACGSSVAEAKAALEAALAAFADSIVQCVPRAQDASKLQSEGVGE